MRLLQMWRRLGEFYPLHNISLSGHLLEHSMACAIREAYAACLNVVILVEGRGDYEDDA